MLIIIIRSVILYALVIAAMRLMGKKQLGELQPSELVTTILISNIATLSLEDASMPMLLGIIPIIMIVCIDVFMSVIMMRNVKFRRMVTGTPRVVVSNGAVDQKELRKLRYTVDDLLEAMRGADIFDINEVQYAIVETTGKISFCKKADSTADPPEVIIKDGALADSGLKRTGLGSEWLSGVLKRRDILCEDVFLLTAEGSGTYTLIERDKHKGSGSKKRNSKEGKSR